MAERIRLTGKNDGVNDNEGVDVQVDSTFNAAHVKSHLYSSDGIDFNKPVSEATPLPVMSFGQLVPKVYDYIGLTYVAAGNGAGEVETVTYKTSGSGGTTVATLTLAYDASNRVATVTRT